MNEEDKLALITAILLSSHIEASNKTTFNGEVEDYYDWAINKSINLGCVKISLTMIRTLQCT